MKILGLIHLGNLLSVGKEIGQAQDIKTMEISLGNHTFQDLVNRQCIAIARDKECRDTPRKSSSHFSVEEWIRKNIDCHRYIYDGYESEENFLPGWFYGHPQPPKRVSPTPPLWPLEKELQYHEATQNREG